MKLQKLWTVELVVTRDEPGARNVYIESGVQRAGSMQMKIQFKLIII